jgi:hypothetical protein
MGIIIKKLKFNTQLEADNALLWVNSQMQFPTNFTNKQNTVTWDNVTYENGFYYFLEPPIEHGYNVVDFEIIHKPLFE